MDKDGDGYSSRMGINLQYLDEGKYTMIFEMYVEDGITVDELNALGDNISVISNDDIIDGTNARLITKLNKVFMQSGPFDELNIDIKLKGKTDPHTIIYVVVYGVKGLFDDVSRHLWDRLYYYDKDIIEYEASFDMNGKDIKGVNEIGIDNLDVEKKNGDN